LLEGEGGPLRISNRLPRQASFQRTPLNARGRVETIAGEPRLFMED
jgi:hypothetical protein